MEALCTVVHRFRVAVVVAAVAVIVIPLAVASPSRAGDYASLIMNAANGDVMYSVDADEPRYPASLTKMMTLFLTFEAIDHGRVRLSDRMSVSAHAASQPPSKLGLRPGEAITVEEAILALVTKSANDAAATLAEYLGGSEPVFAQQMTARAHALGMTGTYFRNASGLPDPGQVTTAHDMARLGQALLSHCPHYYPYFSTETFYYGGVAHKNHNRLLGTYDGVDGIKTGYINASGFNLVASAARGGHRLIGVIFGARSSAQRSRMMTALLDGGFDAFDTGSFVESAALRAPVAAASKAEPSRTRRPAKGVQTIGKTKVEAVAVKSAPEKGVRGSTKKSTTVVATKRKGPSAAGKTVIIGKTKLTPTAKPASKKVAAKKSGKTPSKSAVSANARKQAPQAKQMVAKRRPSGKGSDKQEALKSCQRSSAKTTSCRTVRLSDNSG